MPIGVYARPSLRERFDAKWMPEPNTGCHLWLGSSGVYGKIRVVGPNGVAKTENAQRVAWELTHGKIPDGLHALHRCDTAGCVNPAHLFLGTNLDNIADKMAKGRGVKPPSRAKLLPSQVGEIRAALADGEMHHDIAIRYGVCRATVSQIAVGRNWRHIP